ncbi:MAG: hypothetical protein MJZ98_00520 [Paludibacteraceae bacterium]|nr:hypothetical protein [Paludibacteraceae bacterium]
MKANDLSKFDFVFAGSGHYKVRYTTERGDYYVKLVTDMTIIDATLNAEWAKLEDIKILRDYVKSGTHYSSKGELIEKK